MSIEVRHVSKRFGSVQVLRDVSLTVASGELVALLGPSGSGKTTLLRLISGLEIADAGDILLDGQDTRGQSPRERRAGFVFQHYALFRHMTVFENVAFGLRVRPRGQRLPEAAVRERVGRLLELVHIGSLAQRYPSQLSGGQRQRVALARALAVEPKVLLLDEPFGALEARVRQELRRWLRHLQADLNVTTVLVTHDQEEALEVADRVVVMNEGRIEQVGTPEEVYEHPANPFVYRFMGDVNLFHGRVEGSVAAVGHVLGRAEQGADDALTTRQPDDRALSEATESEQALVGYVRPHDIDLSREPGDPAAVSTMIETVQLVGPAVRLLCRRLDNGAVIEVHLTTRAYREAGLQIGDTAYASPHRMRLYA